MKLAIDVELYDGMPMSYSFKARITNLPSKSAASCCDENGYYIMRDDKGNLIQDYPKLVSHLINLEQQIEAITENYLDAITKSASMASNSE